MSEQTEKLVHILTDTIWNCSAYAMMYGNVSIEFATVNKYKYKISQNPNKGCTVEFNGPVNGLLHQNILPNMTYEEGTLVGKFVDSQTNEDLTPYMNMSDYGKLRAIKNNKASEERRKERKEEGVKTTLDIVVERKMRDGHISKP